MSEAEASFDIPQEWKFEEDSYPIIPKRLLSAKEGSKKKSNRPVSEQSLQQLLSMPIKLTDTSVVVSVEGGNKAQPEGGNKERVALSEASEGTGTPLKKGKSAATPKSAKKGTGSPSSTEETPAKPAAATGGDAGASAAPAAAAATPKTAVKTAADGGAGKKAPSTPTAAAVIPAQEKGKGDEAAADVEVVPKSVSKEKKTPGAKAAKGKVHVQAGDVKADKQDAGVEEDVKSSGGGGGVFADTIPSFAADAILAAAFKVPTGKAKSRPGQAPAPALRDAKGTGAGAGQGQKQPLQQPKPKATQAAAPNGASKEAGDAAAKVTKATAAATPAASASAVEVKKDKAKVKEDGGKLPKKGVQVKPSDATGKGKKFVMRAEDWGSDLEEDMEFSDYSDDMIDGDDIDAGLDLGSSAPSSQKGSEKDSQKAKAKAVKGKAEATPAGGLKNEVQAFMQSLGFGEGKNPTGCADEEDIEEAGGDAKGETPAKKKEKKEKAPAKEEKENKPTKEVAGKKRGREAEEVKEEKAVGGEAKEVEVVTPVVTPVEPQQQQQQQQQKLTRRQKQELKRQQKQAQAAADGQFLSATSDAAAAAAGEKPVAKKQKTSEKTPAAVTAAAAEGEVGADESAASAAVPGSSLLAKMRERLQGGHFRFLNEELYTSSGAEAFKMMQKDPSLFTQYHQGFQSQTKGWPRQPVDVALQFLRSKPPGLVVADFGCGDARLAAQLAEGGAKGAKGGKAPTVHSFDLVTSAPGVVACNMSRVPLADASVDVAVFSLALMGSDYGAFLEEATRVLKYKGWLWVAEVRSRFVAEEGGAEQFEPFLKCLGRMGYHLVSQDKKNTMFVVFVLRKTNPPAAGGALGGGRVTQSWPALRACVYKKR